MSADDDEQAKARRYLVVAIQGRGFRWPDICSCCASRAPQGYLELKCSFRGNSWGGAIWYTPTFTSKTSVPLCSRCLDHSTRMESRGSRAGFYGGAGFVVIVGAVFVSILPRDVFNVERVTRFSLAAGIAAIGILLWRACWREMRRAWTEAVPRLTPDCAASDVHVKYHAWWAPNRYGELTDKDAVHLLVFRNSTRGRIVAQEFVGENFANVMVQQTQDTLCVAKDFKGRL